jgi:hypothetical protein
VLGRFKDVWLSLFNAKAEPSFVKPPSLRSSISEGSPSLVRSLLGSDRILFCRQPMGILAYRPVNNRYEYLELLKVILREACRVTWNATIPSLFIAKRLTEYQLAMLKPAGTIVLVDVDEVSRGESGEAISMLSRLSSTLEDRLGEAGLQVNQPGFIALYGSQAAIHRLQNIWSPRVSKRGHVFYRVQPPIELQIVEDEKVFRAISLMYLVDEDVINEASSVNDAVIAAEQLYSTLLNYYANDPTLSKLARPPVDDEESKPDQSLLHYAVKMITIANLLESGYTESEIEVEVMLGSIPVDILVGGRWSQNIVVEIETLYGSFNPAMRLSTVIRQRLAAGYNLWVVIPPLQASLYAKNIEPLISRYQASVDFYTIDFSSASLISLREFIEKVNNLAAELYRKRLGVES